MQLEHLDYCSPLGRHYRLTLAVPTGVPPQDGWPLACVLDHEPFQAVLTALQPSLPCAVLGVAYARQNWRDLDYTPGEPGEAGRAQDFMLLLRDVFLPWAQAQAPLDAGRRLLCGHSLGGLLALTLLYRMPGVFQSLAVSSPSVWWGQGYLARLLEQPLPPLALAVPVRITVGEYEQCLGPAEQALPPEQQAQRLARLRERRMIDGARELAQALACRQRAPLRFGLIAQCTHSMAGLRALPQACLDWVHAPQGGL
ncbi:alpha/beta hydrolase [Alcaligenes sp. SDU_A2]|uniref:alpha/beta hydrolase n=1 Tax=Alcaligenes sp. SDU_A2 TaxID=3136634 RepID=UPI00311D5DB2